MVNVYTGDWLYLSIDDARLLLGALEAVSSTTDMPIKTILQQHILKLEGGQSNPNENKSA